MEEKLSWISDSSISIEEKQARFTQEMSENSKIVALEQTKKVLDHLVSMEILNYSRRDNIYFYRKSEYIIFLTPESLVS